MKLEFDNLVSVNNYPYFLWSNYTMDKAHIDKNTNTLYGKEKSSNYTPVSPVTILLLKYVPLLMFLPFATIPLTVLEAIFFLIALVCVVFIVSLFRAKEYLYLRLFLLLMLFGVMGVSIFVPSVDIESGFFSLVHYMLMLLLVYVVYIDYMSRDFRKYYKLKEITKDVEGTLVSAGERKFMKIPFTKKALFKYRVREDFKVNLLLGGFYFVVLDNRLDDEKEKENETK